MRVLLINPPNSLEVGTDFKINVFQPIGLAYVAAMLEKNKIKVKILDALAEGFDRERVINGRKMIGLSYEEIAKVIKDYKPDVVGVGAPFSFQAHEMHAVINLVKIINNKIITIAGGSHVTIQPEEVLANKNVDYIIRGEGEYAMLELVRALQKKEKLKNIGGLSYRDKKGKIINNSRNRPILKLDELPNPARNLLPMEKYLEAAKKAMVIEGLLMYGKRRTSIITSRGCPFTCTFCSVYLTMTRVWRGRSPENVLAEIEECINKFGVEYIDILDDNFTLDPERAKKICQLIIDKKLKIKWSTPNGIRADRVDEELIVLMKKAGCIGVKVAPESGSQKVLDRIIKKHLDLKKVKEVVIMCRKHGLPVEAFFVIGFPEEKIKDIKQTIKYAKELRKLGCSFCYFFLATPYFGTEMYYEAIKKRYLIESEYDPNKIFTTSGKSLIQSPNYSYEELMALLKEASRINPPVTSDRLIAGLKILGQDPVRIINYTVGYIKLSLSPIFAAKGR